MIASAGAPIAAEVLEFLQIAFCCRKIEGYGMTETSGGSLHTQIHDPDAGHVGGPMANVKLRLKDIPDMNYLSTDKPPRGEICFWGPSITKGYFRNEEKTKEAFHGDWLMSGDVGMFLPNGSVKIIDRAKHIFKLSQGEYIAPEKLENIYVQSSWIQQAWIHGDSLHDFILLFAVLDPAKTKDLDEEEIKGRVLESITELAAANKLNALEKPKNMRLFTEMWTVESGILTPTLKLKRA